MIDQAHTLSCNIASVNKMILKRFGNYCIDSVNSWDNCPGEKSKKIQKIKGDSLCQYFLFIGMCSTMCNWETENWFVFFLLNFRDFISISLILISTCPLSRCDMGTDANGCWMGNWCQDMSLGEIYMQKTMYQKVIKKRNNLSLENIARIANAVQVTI